MSDNHATIKRLAGAKRFATGQSLFECGAVSSYSFVEPVLSATVEDDGHFYEVRLQVLSQGFDGGCTCPVSDGFDFCEHCVALALYHEAEQAKLAKLMHGTPEEKVQGLLATLPADVLAQSLLDLIKKDNELLQHWSTKAEIASGQFDIKSLRKWVVKALPLREVWRYELVRKYFDKACAQFALIHPLIDELDDVSALHACEFIMSRYDKICERVEDSGGYRFSLESQIEAQYVKTFLRWDASEHNKISYLIELYHNEYLYVNFDDIGQLFLRKAPVSLRQAYYEKLLEVYKQAQKDKHEGTYVKQMASSLAMYYASKEAYQTAMPFALNSYLPTSVKFDMANALISQQHFNDALNMLFALKKHALPQELQRINTMIIKINQLQGKPDDAMQLAMQQYAKTFDIALLKQLAEDHALEGSELVTQAKALIIEQPTHRQERLLFSLYLHFGPLEQAILIAGKIQLADEELHALAYACLQEKHFEQALKLYLSLITRNVDNGQRGYAYIVEILQEIELVFIETNISKAPFNQLLNVLQESYAKKRSFVGLLQHHFN